MQNKIIVMKDEKKIKLRKEYLIVSSILFLVVIFTIIIMLKFSESRGEILSLYICSIFFFLTGLIYNLLYLINKLKLEIRLLLPGILTIFTPIILWKNKDVGIYQYIIFGLINLSLGLYFYFKLRKK